MCAPTLLSLVVKLRQQAGATCEVGHRARSTRDLHHFNKILLRDALGPGAGGTQPNLAAVVDKGIDQVNQRLVAFCHQAVGICDAVADCRNVLAVCCGIGSALA